MIGGRERSANPGVGAGPVVVEGQRGTVVDQVRAAVPEQHVRVAPRPVDVADERVEPQHPSGEAWIHRERGGVEIERSGQEVDAEVGARARPQQLLHLLVGLGRPERRIELHDDQLRNGQVQRPGQLARDDLGHQHRGALPGTGVLDGVRAQVVGLHQAGQRSALAQRGDVADGRHLTQIRCDQGHGDHCGQQAAAAAPDPGSRAVEREECAGKQGSAPVVGVRQMAGTRSAAAPQEDERA